MTASLSAGAPPRDVPGDTRRYPVLIVDDEDSIRETMAEYLDLERFEVLSAADGVSALAIVATQRLSILITDLSMPEGDGISLIQSARRHDPKLPAILLTGFADQAAIAAAGDDYLVLRKPVQMTQLLQHMARLQNASG